jgi:hypothetical protein
MWIFYKEALRKMELISDGMAFSEEIKIEAILKPEIGFREMPIRYSNRAGAKKLSPWRDGWGNLLFLVRKRILSRRSRIPRTRAEPKGNRQHLAGLSHRD